MVGKGKGIGRCRSLGSESKEEWGIGRGRSHGVDGECCNEEAGDRPDNKGDEGDRGKIEEARGGMGDEERRVEGADIDGG